MWLANGAVGTLFSVGGICTHAFSRNHASRCSNTGAFSGSEWPEIAQLRVCSVQHSYSRFIIILLKSKVIAWSG
jgi:hypothetical protein